MKEVAVVTGPSRGIGLEIACGLGRRGFHVAMMGRASKHMEAATERVDASGGTSTVYGTDVSDCAQVRVACEAILRDLGTPRVVINNAAVIVRGQRVDETLDQDWERVIQTNLSAPFWISRAFAGPMRIRGSGRFVHVASISSTLACPGAASYAASKWGLVGFAKSLAEELRGTGVESMCILPGSVDTEMLHGSGFEPQMTAADVAAAVIYLAVDAPSAMNGSAVEMFG